MEFAKDNQMHQVLTGGVDPVCIADYLRLAREIVSPEKVRCAMESFKPYKSPGTDGIHLVLLREGLEEIIGHFVRLARACLDRGLVSMPWRTSKGGKESYTIVKDFRPICLTSFMLKTLKRLVDRCIKDKILTKPSLWRSL